MSMVKKNYTTDERLTMATTAVENGRNNPEIQDLLSAVGYRPDRMTEASEAITSVKALIAKQKREYGEKYAATDALEKIRDKANNSYIRSLKIARILITDPAASASLQLHGERKKSISGWLQQASLFYANLFSNPDWLITLASAGITTIHLEAQQAQVVEVEKALQKQKKETGEAQAATAERDDAVDELFDWMHDYYSFAHIALEDHPQWLEKLGILDRN